MAWALLALTILLEVTGTTLMKLSNGLTQLWPSVGVLLCYALAAAGMALVLRSIELSIAYAVWSGTGTALTAAMGMLWFKEPATALKLLSLALVIAGVIGLQLSSVGNPE